MKIKYGLPNNNIDVTDICREKFITNNIITIPKSNSSFTDPITNTFKKMIEHNGIVIETNKNTAIKINILDNSVFDETPISTNNSVFDETPISTNNSVFDETPISTNNSIIEVTSPKIKIKYGLLDNNIDVTDICIENFLSNLGNIHIPGGNTNSLFGDPIPNNLKKLIIEIGDIVIEYEENTDIKINLGEMKITHFINNPKEVEGIILVLSCHKHLETRLKKYRLPLNNYLGWKVIYVIGDLSLNENYELRENNMLYIKCEDSYIHLLKKLVLSIKYVNELFTIKQGILRWGDDLIFHNERLIEFLRKTKYDFYGQSVKNQDYYSEDINILKNTKKDYFMYNYYKTHTEDFKNPLHNLKDMTLEKLKTYSIRPKLDTGVSGVIYYLSNKSCKILIEHMEKIDYNIFHFDEFSKSYPYTIEDCGVTYIMYYHKIKFTNNQYFYLDGIKDNSSKYIAVHTNDYK